MKIFNFCLVIVFVFVVDTVSMDSGMNPESSQATVVRRKNRIRNAHFQNYTDHLRRHSHGKRDGMNSESNVDLYGILNKINEKLTEIALVSNRQFRRLGNLEYKVTKMEEQFEEKILAFELNYEKLSMAAKELDCNSGKPDFKLHEDREILPQKDSGFPEPADRMQVALRSIQLMQRDVSEIHSDMSNLKTNISSMLSIQNQMRLMSVFQKKDNAVSIASGNSNVCATNLINDEYPSDLPMDCSEIKSNTSGVYRIMPAHSTVPFFVYCDMDTRGGGWTVIQRRVDGSVNFYRSWQDYKRGFGTVGKEHWLGLDKIHLLTSTNINELYIELEDFSETPAFALYDAFIVGNEFEGYPLTYLGNYKGTAGDSLSYHAGHKFSTLDIDQDSWPERSCAVTHEGAWWYNKCDTSNLNGVYMTGELSENFQYKGVYWAEYRGSRYSLKSTKMMVRPKQNN